VVYYGSTSGREGEMGGGGDSIADSNPVRVDILEAPGFGIPETWERMRYLYVKSGRQTDTEFLPGFVDDIIAGEQQRSRKKREGGRRWLVRMNTLLLCKQSGKYEFAVKCRNSAFVFLDGRKVVFRNISEKDDAWTKGEAVELQNGIYRLDVFHCTGQELSLKMGWVTPAEKEIAPLPPEVMITSGDFTDCRLEKIDRSLHADFSWQMQTPYRFLDNDVTFAPVKFIGKIETWLDMSPKVKWRFQGNVFSDEYDPVHVFTNAATERVLLKVRDSMGFEDECEKRIDFLLSEPEVLYVDSSVRGLPPVCFPGDSIDGMLEINGDIPKINLWELDFSIQYSDKREMSHEQEISLPYKTNFCGRAADFREINWQLKHHKVIIDRGKVVFVRPPYDSISRLSIRGEGFFDENGSRIVMISPVEGIGYNSSIQQKNAGNTVVFVGSGPLFEIIKERKDVFLNISSKNNEPPIDFKMIRFDSWQECPEAYGPLLKVTAAIKATHENPCLVVFAAGYDDFMTQTIPAEFERHAAIMTDMIAARSTADVMWVVPPPYGGQRGKMMPYAEAICRIAYKRKIPAIDLYSMMCAEGAENFFDVTGVYFNQYGKKRITEIMVREILKRCGGNGNGK